MIIEARNLHGTVQRKSDKHKREGGCAIPACGLAALRALRKLHIAYSGSDGNTARYHCKGAAINHGSLERCISFGSLRVDKMVASQVPATLRLVGIRAALHAIEQHARDDQTRRRQLELALEQVRLRGGTGAASVRRR